MTQFQHTLKALLEGRKTETSRIALPESDGTGTFDCEMIGYPMGIMSVQRLKMYSDRWKTIRQVGKDYAIEPHRGVKSVGRYRVEAIWRQDVRTLTLGQVDDEGFNSWIGFWETWCKMHDPSAVADIQHIRALTGSQLDAKKILMNRPAERYQAWRMTIQILWDTIDYEAPAVKALQIEPKVLD